MKLLLFIILSFICSYSLHSEEQFNINHSCIKIDSNNYIQILENNESGYYKNPFNNKCFALSFIKDDTYFNENDIKSNEEHIKESFFNFIYGSGLEVIHVKREHNIEYYDFLKFDKKSRKLNLLAFSEKLYPSSFFSKHYEEIYFVHEVFHLQEYDFFMNKGEYYKHEVLADIGSILLVSNKYKLSTDSIRVLINNMKTFRAKFLDRTMEKNSIYDSLYSTFAEDIENLNISKLNNFSDIHLYLKKY